MVRLKRWFVAMAVGGTLLVGLTGCVVAPAAPVPSGYVVSPPAVVVRPYYGYRIYRPYRFYRPYRPYYGYGWHPYRYRW
jgi:hypothetical protein